MYKTRVVDLTLRLYCFWFFSETRLSDWKHALSSSTLSCPALRWLYFACGSRAPESLTCSRSTPGAMDKKISPCPCGRLRMAPGLPDLFSDCEQVVGVNGEQMPLLCCIFFGAMTPSPMTVKFIFWRNDTSPMTVKFGDHWVSSSSHAVHLGHVIGPGRDIQEMSMDAFIKTMNGKFYQMISQLSKCSVAVKLKLFQTYCVHYYGTMLWDLNSIEPVSIAWRTCMRMLLGVDGLTHRVLIPHIAGNKTVPLDFRLHKLYLNFISNCLNSNNEIVRMSSRTALSNASSITRRNVLNIYKTHIKVVS